MEATLNAAITSGQYSTFLNLVKSFRNGLVYGVKVRFPHSLVMTVLFSRGPLEQMFSKIFLATKQHGLNLAKFALVYKFLILVLGKYSGQFVPLHAAVAGAIGGALCWGEATPVNVQINMYLLSRIISGFLFLFANNIKYNLPAPAFRVHASLMWASVMYLFYCHPEVLQGSLQSSMKYIYKDSEKYSNWKNLLLYNSETTI